MNKTISENNKKVFFSLQSLMSQPSVQFCSQITTWPILFRQVLPTHWFLNPRSEVFTPEHVQSTLSSMHSLCKFIEARSSGSWGKNFALET